MYLKDFIEKIKQEVDKQVEQDFGLSIAYTLVQLHGGSIKVMQNNPKGTTVIVKI